MYSHQGGRPGSGAPRMTNRYMKGRLPEGVDFAAYPGRSSTPLPTAESKSAERINQLKIWNEAATNVDKRRLNHNTLGSSPSASLGSGRRTDSFKQAKDRHSASFSGSPPSANNPSNNPDLANTNSANSQRHPIRTGGILAHTRDMFADRSDSDSEDDDDEYNDLPPSDQQTHTLNPSPDNPSNTIVHDSNPINPQTVKKPDEISHTIHQNVKPNTSQFQQVNSPIQPIQKPQPTQPVPPQQEPKDSKACCIIM